MKKIVVISSCFLFLFQQSFAQKQLVKTPPQAATEKTATQKTTTQKATATGKAARQKATTQNSTMQNSTMQKSTRQKAAAAGKATTQNSTMQKVATTENPAKASATPAKYMTEEELRNLLKDVDGDGVLDILDRESNTPADCPVDTRGVLLDSDGDGVKDCDDKEPYTEPGFPVYPNGEGYIIRCIDCSGCGFQEELSTEPVYFKPNSYALTPEAQVKLRLIAHFLLKNHKICLAVEGYVGQYETTEIESLSYHRAKAVADFLNHYYQIANERLKVKIKGRSSMIIVNGEKKQDDRFNCRVEFTAADCTDKCPQQN